MTDTPENKPTDGQASEAEASADALALQAQLAEAEARAASARDAQLRAIAELDNVRRRLERERDAAVKFANENLLRELVNICDSLELGLKAAENPEVQAQARALIEGKQLTYKQLMALLEKFGVRQLDPVGKPFNPDQHQAMSMVESPDVAPNHVVSVLQKGYTLHDRLLRPATVVVAKTPALNPAD